jgi:hypothetical protein
MVVASVRSGEVIASARGIVMKQAPYWEDARHFLVAVQDHILRVGVDGSLERAAGPATSGQGFLLPAPEQ